MSAYEFHVGEGSGSSAWPGGEIVSGDRGELLFCSQYTYEQLEAIEFVIEVERNVPSGARQQNEDLCKPYVLQDASKGIGYYVDEVASHIDAGIAVILRYLFMGSMLVVPSLISAGAVRFYGARGMKTSRRLSKWALIMTLGLVIAIIAVYVSAVVYVRVTGYMFQS